MTKAFNAIEAREFARSSKNSLFMYSNAGKAFHRIFKDSPKMVFPGIDSWSTKMLDFTTKLPFKLQEELSINIRDDGFFDSSAVSSNFMNLNTVSGVLMKPIGYTLVNNQIIRDENNLVNGFVSDRHRKIFHEMMKCKYSDFDEEASAKISRISSSGFPLFSNDIAYKHQHLKIISDNFSSIMKNFRTGDLKTNYNRYGLIAASSLSVRNQADGYSYKNGKWSSKDRLVNDLDFALSGGLKGNRYVADKSVRIDGILEKGKSSHRTRIVNALPSAYNNVGSVVLEGLRSSGENKYNKTWKHKGKDNVLEKIKSFDNVIGLDVTQYDNSFPEWLYEEWLECLPVTDDFRMYARLGMKAPSFYSSNGAEHDPVWTGNPFDIEYYNQFSGLPSGIFYTSMLGKDGFTWAVLCILDDIHKDVLGNVDIILKHEHPLYAISNMGDDTIVHAKDLRTIENMKFKAEHSDYGMSPYFKVDIEDGFKFLGMVGYKDNDENINLCGDVGSYLSNMIVPERSLDSRMRAYGVYGLLERRNVFMDNPSFEKVDEIFQKLFRDTFNVNFIDLLQENCVMPSSKNVNVVSPADLEVLLDPSKLFYKYDEKDISASVIDIVQEKIDRNITKNILDHCLKF